MVDTDDTVELEDTSRSRGFIRGFRGLPEEEAKGDSEEWNGGEDEGEGGAPGGDRVRIKSVSSMLYSADFLRLSTSSTMMENAVAVVGPNRDVGSPLPSVENGMKAALVGLAFLV